MADLIQLLPDHIANQIAAGEVIQRPASLVKELMENAIDAGATSIKLVVKDAGKTLVQVIDNGCGMSEMDARICFARHATSKIKEANDLFSIKTMGFRGEALASIAAISQVEMRTKKASDELGTKIVIEGSEVKTQEACQCAAGTTLSIKNLFFNVPARRKFLKSDAVEMSHIYTEFQRVALANPDIFFSLHHNGSEAFHLPAGKLRQRIVGIFGNNCNKKLVPVGEETDVLKISGYVGKPEFAKKKRGDQYFFVNNRFIKSGYLHHAVMTAYEDILQKNTYPLYVVFIEMDPSKLDINIHPTKQEIKFDDERLVYNYLKVAVRHALGQYSISPVLDFDQETFFSNQPKPQQTENRISREHAPLDFTKFSDGTPVSGGQSYKKEEHPLHEPNLQNWQKMYEGLQGDSNNGDDQEQESMTIESQWTNDAPLDDQEGTFSKPQKRPYQIHNQYIVNQMKSGFVLIDQQAAHERILYERYMTAFEQGQIGSQKQLFPKKITLSIQDMEMMQEILPQVNQLGFEIEEFGNDTLVVHGAPVDLKSGKEEEVLEQLLEQYKQNIDLYVNIQDNLARSLARSMAVKRGQELAEIEMEQLIDELFACQVPFKSPGGKFCFITYDLEELAKRFSS